MIKIYEFPNMVLIGKVINEDVEKHNVTLKDVYYVLFDPQTATTYLQKYQVYANNLFKLDLNKVNIFSEPEAGLLDYYGKTVEKFYKAREKLIEDNKKKVEEEKAPSLPIKIDLESLDVSSMSIN